MSTSANTLYGSPKREISVILPVLNEAKYLEDSVNSILSQNFDGALEVILAVGPSEDATMQIAQALHAKDSRVVVVENPTGRTAPGLNRAIAVQFLRFCHVMARLQELLQFSHRTFGQESLRLHPPDTSPH